MERRPERVALAYLLNGHSRPLMGGVLSITDSGSGMGVETRRRVCEPFFSQGKEHGVGLGMAIVHRIAEQHGATLAIQNKTDQGMRVELHFPKRVPERGLSDKMPVQH
jgi:nitrogen fixation/metabolism regulation signal transduction histidine kinase